MSNKQVTVNLKGVITATSNKQGKIKSDNPTKGIYVTVDEQTALKLEKMNMTRFTTKKDNVDFFIFKSGEQIKKYGSEGLEYVSCKAESESPNFDTQGMEVGISLLYGQSDKSITGTYVRLTALNDPEDSFKYVEDINPFEEDDNAALPF